MILSDTHLGPPGRGAGDAERLRPLWGGADQLILNGDIAEVHDHTHRALAARQIMKIESMCEQDGVVVTMLSGNHDPLLTDRRYLELNQGEVFVTHGDALHPAISPWTEHRAQLRRLHDDAEDRLEPGERLGRDSRLTIAQYAAHFKWDEFAVRPHVERTGWRRRLDQAVKVARVMWYWQTLPRRAASFAKTYCPGARFFVFGHIHRAGIWKMGGCILINTGAYDFPRNPHAVVIEDGHLSVYRVVVGDDDRFHLASRHKARYGLHRGASVEAA